MDKEQRTAIVEAFLGVAEKLAFMFPELIGEPAGDEQPPRNDSVWSCASMAFKGPMSGIIKLAMPADACLTIAANMLGIDPSDMRARDRGGDALCELLNVTCGQVLLRLEGDKTACNMSVPATADLGAAARASMWRDKRVLRFTADDCPMMLLVSMEERP